MKSLLDHALAYAELGWYVFPCHWPIKKAGWSCSCELWKREKVNEDFECHRPGKHPRTENGLDDATTDADQIRAWWKRWPTANIGINCGMSGLLVVDLDTYKEQYQGDDLALDEETVTALSGGGGAHLFYALGADDTFGNRNKHLPDGIDIRGHGGYVIVAPSSHKSGNAYQWENDYSPWDKSPAPIPPKLRALLEQSNQQDRPTVQFDTARKYENGQGTVYGIAAITNQCKAVSMAVNGTRNNTLNTAAFALGRLVAGGELEYNYAYDNLYSTALSIDLTDAEAKQTIDSGMNAGMKSPYSTVQLEDDGFGECPDPSSLFATTGQVAFVADLLRSAAALPTYREQSDALSHLKPFIAKLSQTEVNDHTITQHLYAILKTQKDVKEFLEDCKNFAPAENGNILLSAGTHDEGNAQCTHHRHEKTFLYNDAWGWLHYTGTHWTSEGADAAVERAITETLEARITAAVTAGAQQYKNVITNSIPNHSKISGAKNQLRSMVYAPVHSFDNNPDLLNCKNGVVDLRTGELSEHNIDQRFMYCINYDYNPHANYEPWIEWLMSVTSKETAEWLQMAQGYSLTGHTREEILFYLFGPSRSGKGTYTSAMLRLLGEPLAKAVQFSMFTAVRGGDDQNFDLAPLKPCRFIAASESRQYERFNEAKVKQITGGDSVSCAFKHRDHFTYTPQFKIWLSSNHPVNADPDDDAVWGRIRVVQFPNSYLGKEDKGLKMEMQSDEMMEAILVWAVTGAQRWYSLGKSGLPEMSSGEQVKQQQREDLDTIQMWIDDCCKVHDMPAGITIDYEEWCKANGKWFSSSTLYQSYSAWCIENGVESKKHKGFTQTLVRKGFPSGRITPKGLGDAIRVIFGIETK